jgi:hydrogenase nickel incorporation protein HypA/HybF
VHELSLMEAVVDEVVERIGDRRVAVVRLAIGELAGVAIDALRFCFEACAHRTPLAGATLDIVAIPGRMRCSACGSEHPMPTLAAPCPCGSFAREPIAGLELRLVEVEIA